MKVARLSEEDSAAQDSPLDVVKENLKIMSSKLMKAVPRILDSEGGWGSFPSWEMQIVKCSVFSKPN